MNQRAPEPSQELPAPFWNAHARPEDKPVSVVEGPPPRELLQRASIVSVEGIRELAKYRHPSTVPIFMQGLKSRNAQVAFAAGRALCDAGEPGFRALVKAAQEGRGRAREQAIRSLGDFGDSRAIEVLLGIMRQERRERMLQNTVITICISGWNLLLFVLSAGLELLLAAASKGHHLGGECVGGAAQMMSRPREHWNRDNSLRMCAAEALGRLGDVRAIPPLVQMLRSGSEGNSRAATVALAALLPLASSLRMEQSGSVPSELVPALAILLNTPNLEFARQALSALYAIGDGRALPAVERFAEYRTVPDPEYRHLGSEAAMLIPILRERSRQDENRRTLLRGTSAPQNSPQELLRAAQGTPLPGIDPNQLLRSSSSAGVSSDIGNDRPGGA